MTFTRKVLSWEWRYWRLNRWCHLTLSCGHRTFRRKPPAREALVKCHECDVERALRQVAEGRPVLKLINGGKKP